MTEERAEYEVMNFKPDNELNLVFNQDNEEVGRFWYDRKSKRWNFSGNKEKSAVEFVAWVMVSFREQMYALYGQPKKELKHDQE